MRRGVSGGVGSNSPACAACKHQRRKCASSCPLAPHFPPSRNSDFLNAHRLFGVSNILKTLSDVADPALKAHAVTSIVFHANARAADPVGGCFRIVSSLRRQIHNTQAELNLVRRHLQACRDYHAPPFHVSSQDIKPFLHMFDHDNQDSIHQPFHNI